VSFNYLTFHLISLLTFLNSFKHAISSTFLTISTNHQYQLSSSPSNCIKAKLHSPNPQSSSNICSSTSLIYPALTSA